MYTRSFYGEDGVKMNIPDNYNGTALQEERDNEIQSDGSFRPEEKTEPAISTPRREEGFFGILKNLPFGHFFDGGGLFSKNIKIGSEELMLLGVAALLFFSKNGDKDCALWLLLLLFI